MIRRFGRAIETLSSNKRLLFAVDGVGALLSAVTLGLVLPVFQAWIGLQLSVLFLLAIGALALAIYSLVNAFGIILYRPIWLKITIAGNIFYCATTAMLLIAFSGQITALGAAYFLGELVIILALATIEIMALKEP